MEAIEPTEAEIAEIAGLIEEATQVGDSACAYSAQRLRMCVVVGKRLMELRKSISRGHWESFVEEKFPTLTRISAYRWCRLAQAEASGQINLETTRGLRHAYKLAELLPDSDETKSKSAKAVSYLVHIARLVAALQHIDVQSLSAVDRSTLVERLAPVAKLHQQLTTNATPAG